MTIVKTDKFNAGQDIFRGQAEPGSVPPTKAETQAERLAAIQQRLPALAQQKADLPALAGKLTDEQMGELEYYVEYRYGVKLPAVLPSTATPPPAQADKASLLRYTLGPLSTHE